MKKTIIIFTIYLNNEFYCPSFIYSHAKGYVDMGYKVIIFAQKAVLPFV